jgi:hypothetical protein
VMSKGQKQAVVEAVQIFLPNFNLYKDIALVMLTKNQLEDLKCSIGDRIRLGEIDYSKDRSNTAEVYAYARSCVMNHLKKAKELNGNQIYGVGSAVVQSRQLTTTSINTAILPDDLKAFVKTLVE